MAERNLTSAASALLLRNDAERIASLRNFPFVFYDKANRIRDRLSELLDQPRSHRPQSMLIAGATNNGKTMLVNKFLSSRPIDNDPKANRSEAKVLYIQMPPVPDQRQFYLSILQKLECPVRTTTALGGLQSLTMKILETVNTKMLIIDEIHNIYAGRFEQQRAFLNILRYISNEHHINIVCCGIENSVRALQYDEQLANRFEHWTLPRWGFNDTSRKLLATLETTLPLRHQSHLANPDTMRCIISLSEGTIGEIARLITSAAQRAIATQRERIDVELVGELGWVPPSQRRREAERVLGLS